ncbi:MAG: hypothetical protein VZS44_10290 [Bacilli bacterium]|nr:hypothetical protein [Bacilli bacterium]
MTEEIKKKLFELFETKKHVTDSDIRDFCEDNNIHYREVSLFIAKLTAPQYCQECKYVECYNSNFGPCSMCLRNQRIIDCFELCK